MESKTNMGALNRETDSISKVENGNTVGKGSAIIGKVIVLALCIGMFQKDY